VASPGIEALSGVDTSGSGGKYLDYSISTKGGPPDVANHLTPSELAEELHMKRQEVIGKCVEMGIPIFRGRIDKSLFRTSLRQFPTQSDQRPASAA
jgi:hypothetical protein